MKFNVAMNKIVSGEKIGRQSWPNGVYLEYDKSHQVWNLVVNDGHEHCCRMHGWQATHDDLTSGDWLNKENEFK